MPRGKPSTSRLGNVSRKEAVPSSSHVAPSQTQSQAERAAANMEPEDLNRKVEELVLYLLVMDQKKVPIKKIDINKSVLKDCGRVLPVVMKKAAKRLSEVFGIEVVELQEKLKGSYILINKLEDQSHLIWSEMEEAKLGLLMVILSIIFMNNNVIQDGDLWHSLRSLGIDSDVNHETFGDVKKLITQEFVKHAYLEMTRLQNSELPIFEVRWGQRAKLETTKKNVLKFVCLMYSMEPEQWRTQYDDILAEEEQNLAAH